MTSDKASTPSENGHQVDEGSNVPSVGNFGMLSDPGSEAPPDDQDITAINDLL